MRTLRHIVDQRAKSPDRVYLHAPETGRAMTYGALRDHALRLSTALRADGLAKGDKVALIAANGYQTAALFLGAMYGGFVVAPINLLSQPSQLAYVLEHSDARVVYTAPEHVGRLEAALQGRHERPIVRVIDPDSPALHADVAPDPAPFSVAEDDEALLMYTSGTTGRPKGALLSHRNVVSGGQFVTEAHALTEDDCVLCSLPLYHINGQIVTTVAPLVHGGSVVMPHRFSVSNFWDLLAQYRCTWFNVVPTIISYLLNAADPRVRAGELDLARVRFGRSASSALPPSIHRAFEDAFGFGVIETMGLTETAAPILSNPLDPAKRKYGSPGRPVGNEARIARPDGRTAGIGEVGEILVRGDNVMKGYYKDPEITAQTLEPDGWLHTGDLGYVDEDGYFFVTGRLKELIIKGGENIAPREIDEVLYRHPAVLEAAAVGIPDDQYGQEIMACVVLKPGHQCSGEELISWCRRELGRFKTPKIVHFVDALPKGPSGKVQRLKLVTKKSA